MTPFTHACLQRFLNEFADRIHGAVADYGGVKRYAKEMKRLLASGGVTDYTRIDYETGYDLMKPVKGRKYDVGICMDLLEHVPNPILVGKNITNSLKKGGIMFVTVPFIWELHEYPKDYWRFTLDGLKLCFPNLHVIEGEHVNDLFVPVPGGTMSAVDQHWTTRVNAVFERLK